MSGFTRFSIPAGALLLLLTSCGTSELLNERVVPQPSSRDGGSVAERKMAALIRGHSGQNRKHLNWDSRLAKSARKRAKDMGRRNYFSHTDPDGYGPNWHVTQAGYRLPISWTAFKDGNQVESIVAGYPTAEEAFYGWMQSPKHLSHLIARNRFYQEQTNFGVGHSFIPGSKHGHYWVLHTAPPSK